MTVGAASGLEDKVVLVTGASRGIGAAVALAAARAGADVAVGYRTRRDRADAVASSVRVTGRRALVVRADVTRRNDVDRMVARAVREMGGIDALVNNAANLGSRRPFLELSVPEWRAMLEANVTGVFHCTQAVVPAMLERGGGRIVNVSSRLGQVGAADQVHYATAKAAVIGMTRALARELGHQGIRVNAVAPAAVHNADRPSLEGAALARKLAELPLGRLAMPAEIADTVLFLLSDAAEQFLGQTLNPSGGGYMG